jgi:hypothetical protein
VINGGITITDPDSTRLTFATVAITVGYNKNQDRLVFVKNPALTADIEGTFDVNTGIMRLTTAGSIPATLAQYQAALRLVQYQNIATFPFKGQRVITYQVSDGAGLSNKLTSSITFN